MPRPPKAKSAAKDSTANLGFEAKLWLAADKLRNNMDAAEPERSGDSQPQAARRASEARQYKAENVFWVPAETRWSHLQANAKQATMARRWATPGSSSSAATRASRACCPRTTCVLAS